MDSIESSFVPYQIALDMKSIGFDEPCLAVFTYGKTFKMCSEMWDSFDENHLQINNYHYFGEDTDGDLITAPTFSQTFKFFREKCNLISHIYPESLNGNILGYYYVLIESDKYKHSESTDYNQVFKTYESAELGSIKKLIEICKNKE
ncbi:MAG TPA: hypothetical protein PLP73_03635 [Candidatus Absconditabacterales bacterium]|nr:hypothetical protein [Candidatus Absconditabacterales bacterium]